MAKEKKIRIACLVSNDLVTDQRMQRISNSLVEFGYQVSLVGRKKTNSIPLPSFSFKCIRLELGYEKGPLFYLFLNLAQLKWLISNKPDIVNAVDLDTILSGIIYKILFKKKLVYDAHEYYPYSPEIVNRPKLQGFWLWVEKLAFKYSDSVYTVSKGIANEYKKEYNADVSVIRNTPLKNSIIANDKVVKKNTLVYAGAINEGRGIEQLISALPLLRTECELHIIGSGDKLESIKKQVEELKLREKVLFHGLIKPKDLRGLLPTFYIGINTGENKSKSYELSLPNKLFDYMHAGLPQIASPFIEFKHINEEYNFCIFTNLNAKELAEKINQLLEDDVLWNNLRENSLAAAEYYYWEKEAQQLLPIYKALH